MIQETSMVAPNGTKWLQEGSTLFYIQPTNVNAIYAGDVIVIYSEEQQMDLLVTICKKDIGDKDPFWGRTIRGRSYKCGHEPVRRAVIFHATKRQPHPPQMHS